jgi:hypothetical protein
MTPVTFTAETPAEALILEQAQAFARQLARTADAAPDGQVLRLAEQCVLASGRDLMRRALEIVLQTQAEAVEKKGRLTDAVAAAAAATTRASRHGMC